MTKKDFIIKVAKEAGFTQGDVDIVLNAARTVTIEGVRNKDKIPVLPGIFVEGVAVADAVKRNPYTGGSVEIPAHIKPKARFTETFKDEVKA